MSTDDSAAPKSVSYLDWGIVAAGVLALIFSFVSYYSYNVTARTSGTVAHIHLGTVSAWNGFFGWFAAVLAVLGSALVAIDVLTPNVKLPVPRRLTGLAAYAAAVLCVLLALFFIPGVSGTFGLSSFKPLPLTFTVDKGHAGGYWLSLIVIIAGFVLSLMRFQATGGKLPGPLKNVPDISGPAK